MTCRALYCLLIICAGLPFAQKLPNIAISLFVGSGNHSLGNAPQRAVPLITQELITHHFPFPIFPTWPRSKSTPLAFRPSRNL
jgi:hypothetical protein